MSVLMHGTGRSNLTSYQTRQGFWSEAIAFQGSVTFQVLPSVLAFGLVAGVITGVVRLLQGLFHTPLTMAYSPLEFAGVGLGILLVIRMNAGYERWWESRKLWGGIVNQSRNLVISAMAYGPNNLEWRTQLIRWATLFPRAVLLTLRRESPTELLASVSDRDSGGEPGVVDHLPSYVALRIGELLLEARERYGMDGFVFIQLDRERAMLLDHAGSCERILSTPLPRVYSINIRRFILLYLLLLPFALINPLNASWGIPFVTMLTAYALLSLDQIGVELENPFATASLSHLPLDDIVAGIEKNVLGVLAIKTSSL